MDYINTVSNISKIIKLIVTQALIKHFLFTLFFVTAILFLYLWNVSSEHTIKQSGQMRSSIQRTFPIGSDLSVQEVKSMLKQVYKKMGLNTGRGITTKELEQYAEVEKGWKHDNRTIKILKFK